MNQGRNSWELRLSGTGGQGIILAGVILAEAAVRQGLNVVQTQVYGPESRGGASRAEVIISRGHIAYPKVSRPDVLLVMSQEAANRYVRSVGADGLIIADVTHVRELPETAARTVKVPISATARDELGREIVASVVATGVLAALTGVVGREALEEAVTARVPRGTSGLNLKAMAAGYKLVGA